MGLRIHWMGPVLALMIAGTATPAGAQYYWDFDGNDVPEGGWLGTLMGSPETDLIFKVRGDRALLLEGQDYGATPNLIGGYSGNSATGGVVGAAIGGGGYSGNVNTVSGNYGTIGGGAYNSATEYATAAGGRHNRAVYTYASVGGGYDNTAWGPYSTIGGGHGNSTFVVGYGYETIGGGYSNFAQQVGTTIAGGYDNLASGTYATVGGGRYNEATSNAATVAGGEDNTATAWFTSVGGGLQNNATGYAAMIPGGHNNAAAGEFSFAAGRRAKANSNGCFVWADSTDADLTCSNTNRAVMRTSGGFYIYSNAAMTTGVRLVPGGGAWSNLSDVALKRDFGEVDPEEVLDLVASLEISSWRYQDEPDRVRHIGPMAQDFYEAFGLGDSERYISTVDADGVALAAIQALHLRVLDLEQDVRRLNEQVAGARTAGHPPDWRSAGLSGLGFALLGAAAAGMFLGRRRRRDR